MRTYVNPLEYTDFDEFPRDTEQYESFRKRRAARARDPEARERSLRRMQQEWGRIYNSVMSPAAREKAIARMENTRHDFNVIIWSGAGDTGTRAAFRSRFEAAMKPSAINLIVSASALRSIAIGGVEARTGDLRRSRRESIYTAHTLLHRIGDDHAATIWVQLRDGLLRSVVTASTLAPYVGRRYRAVLVEMVRRVAGAYLADPNGLPLFSGDAPMNAPAPDRAARLIAQQVGVPVALLAFDPQVAQYFTVSGRERFSRRFGEEHGESRRYRAAAAAEGEEMRPFDPVRQMQGDVDHVFSLILDALFYAAGTTWMSRMDLASSPSQTIADTFAQTEIYGGTKFAIGREFGRVAPRAESKTPSMELPEDLVEEVNAALVPVARAFDEYNNAVLDYLVGQAVEI